MKRVAALAALLLLAGCGGPAQGEVVGKAIKPPYTWVQMNCVPVGKTTVCTPIVHNEPECPELTLRDGDGDHHKVCVSRDVYERTSFGTWYAEPES